MDLRKDLERIAAVSLEAVNPRAIIARCMRVQGDFLRVETPDARKDFELARFGRVFVLGFGKAAGPMAQAVEEILGHRIAKGLVVVKPGREVPLQRIRQMVGGHPVPDQNSVRAAAEIAALADEADEHTLVIVLVSGGGSALLSAPLDTAGSVTLGDIQQTTRRLLACGASIAEVNCVRKHLLLLAGGRLAQRIAPASSLTLALSDVVGNDFQTIASGPTSPDDSTYESALSIIQRFRIGADLPKTIMDFLARGAAGKIPETPKPGAPELSPAFRFLAGTNMLALEGAASEAARLGYDTIILTSHLVGEAREAARVIAAVAKDAAAGGLPCARPACILAGGETTVTVLGEGKGGRNQEMALAFLEEIDKDPHTLSGTRFLAFSTDGEDGPTDAAGGFAFPALSAAARDARVRAADFLRTNDSYAFLQRLGGLFMTGPTDTNVCDIQIVLIE